MTDIAADCKRGGGVATPHACCVAQIAATNFALKSMSIQCVGRRPNRLSCDFSTYPSSLVRLDATVAVGVRPLGRGALAVAPVEAGAAKVGRGSQSYGRMRRCSGRHQP